MQEESVGWNRSRHTAADGTTGSCNSRRPTIQPRCPAPPARRTNAPVRYSPPGTEATSLRMPAVRSSYPEGHRPKRNSIPKRKGFVPQAADTVTLPRAAAAPTVVLDGVPGPAPCRLSPGRPSLPQPAAPLLPGDSPPPEKRPAGPSNAAPAPGPPLVWPASTGSAPAPYPDTPGWSQPKQAPPFNTRPTAWA